MNEISNLASTNYAQFQARFNSGPRQAAESEVANSQQVREIASGEENESGGDSSQNAIQFNVQGPSNEFSAGLDREQLIQGLDDVLARQAVERSIEAEANTAEEEAVSSVTPEEQTTPVQAETATADVQAGAAETLNAAQPAENQEAVEAISQYNGNQQQVDRQDIFFSRVENPGLDVRA